MTFRPILLIAGCAGLLFLGGKDAGPVFDPIRVVKPFPALKDPEVLAADAADAVRDSELVIGLSVNGEARAYPINMLNGPTREIINDRLGGRWIAATW